MKRYLKSTANVLALIIIAPAALSCGLGRLSKVFQGWSQVTAILPGLPGEYLRRAFYRATLASCASDCCLGFGTLISHASSSIGHRAYVGWYCVLGDVEIGDDVLLGSHVSIINGGKQHGIERLDIPVREQVGEWPRVVIGEDSWIGDRAVVLADIGKHCVIGAGSIVTRPIPDYAIAVGSPARVIRWRKLPDETVSDSKITIASTIDVFE